MSMEHFDEIDSDQTISGLTASTTNYIYVDRDLSTSALTYGHITLTPDYGYVRPSSPSSGQHHFNIPKMTMEVYNGTSWETKQRVFLGEAVTDASSVTSVITYALQSRYESEWFALSANSNYTKNHNIGCYPRHITWFSNSSTSFANSITEMHFYVTTQNQGLTGQSVNINQAKLYTYYANPDYAKLIIERGF